MIRTAFGKVALLALTTAIVGSAVVGCSGSDVTNNKTGTDVADGKHGGVGLNLQPVSGVLIDLVAYKVTQGAGGALVKGGNIPVPGTGADFSFGVPLPVGAGYFLSLEAASTDGKVTCAGGFGPFAITANTGIDITPTLTCTDITTGQPYVNVDVETTACPDITFGYAVATPKSANVGSSISLLSLATSASSAGLNYTWEIASPGVGTFANPLAKDTTLNCAADGSDVLVTVTADNGECQKSISTRVSCVNALCGNGVVNTAAGETCDTALDPTCPADCNQVCGQLPVEGTEQCEPPGTSGCTDTCQIRGIACGDGFLVAGEQCDIVGGVPTFPAGTPAGATCNPATCTSTQPVSCGDGIINGTETCDAVGGNNYTVADCGDAWPISDAVGTPPPPVNGTASSCSPITAASCVACENASECAELVGSGLVSGNATEGPAVGTSRKELYNEVLDCVRDTHCATGLVIDCYCGSASGPDCDAGKGTGLCRKVIERGLETTNPADIPTRLTNLTLGGGLALARVNCDQINCATNGCL